MGARFCKYLVIKQCVFESSFRVTVPPLTLLGILLQKPSMGPKILLFSLPFPSLGLGVPIQEHPVPADQAPEEKFQPIKLAVPTELPLWLCYKRGFDLLREEKDCLAEGNLLSTLCFLSKSWFKGRRQTAFGCLAARLRAGPELWGAGPLTSWLWPHCGGLGSTSDWLRAQPALRWGTSLNESFRRGGSVTPCRTWKPGSRTPEWDRPGSREWHGPRMPPRLSAKVPRVSREERHPMAQPGSGACAERCVVASQASPLGDAFPRRRDPSEV